MADNVLVTYDTDVKGFKQVGQEVQKVTNLITEQQSVIKATYSDKSLDDAAPKIKKIGDTVEETTKQFGSLKAQLASVKDQLAKTDVGTKKFAELTQEAGKLRREINAAGEAIKQAASHTRLIDASIQGTRGLSAASALLGIENTGAAKTALYLAEAQELVALASEESTIKTYALAAATKVATVAEEIFGRSAATAMALATVGISVLIGVIIFLIANFDKLTGSTGRSKEEIEDFNREIEDNIKALERQKKLLEAGGKGTFIIDVKINKEQLKKAQADVKDAQDEINDSFFTQLKFELLQGDASLNEKQKKLLNDSRNALKDALAAEAELQKGHEKELEEIAQDAIVRKLQAGTQSRAVEKKIIDAQFAYERQKLVDKLGISIEYYIALSALEAEHNKKLLDNDQKYDIEDLNLKKSHNEYLTKLYSQDAAKELEFKIKGVEIQKQLDIRSLADTADRVAKEVQIIKDSQIAIGQLRAEFAERIYQQQAAADLARQKTIIATQLSTSKEALDAQLEIIDIEAAAQVDAQTKDVTNEKERWDIINAIESEANKKRTETIQGYYDKVKSLRQTDIDNEAAHAKAVNALIKGDTTATPNTKFAATIKEFDIESDRLKKSAKETKDTYDKKIKAAEENSQSTVDLKNAEKTDLEKINDAIAKNEQDKANSIHANSVRLATDFADKAKQALTAVSDLGSAIFAGQLQSFQEQVKYASAQLDKEHQKQLERAGDNAIKRAAIDRRYNALKQKQDQEAAVKEAQIKRKQAIFEKAIKITEIAISTALNIVKVFPNPILIALAAAAGAVAIATAAAQPLPAIPKFEKGGAVVKAGGRNDDGMLYGRSHRQGGMLIEAQGGEYIWDIPTVKKHGDIIKAAHENRLEGMIFHKYIVPAMQSKQQAPAQRANESYDDFRLRVETKNVSRAVQESTKHIVRAIREGNNGYLNSRYA